MSTDFLRFFSITTKSTQWVWPVSSVCTFFLDTWSYFYHFKGPCCSALIFFFVLMDFWDGQQCYCHLSFLTLPTKKQHLAHSLQMFSLLIFHLSNFSENLMNCNVILSTSTNCDWTFLSFTKKKLAVSKHEVLSEQTPPLSRYTTSGIHEISNISLML